MLTNSRKARAEAFRADTLVRIAAATEEARRHRTGQQPQSGQPQP